MQPVNNITRVGIIGTGNHGSRYANHIVNDLGHCFELAAISRRSPAAQAQAQAWNTTLYNDWRELVGSNTVDAVISATTPNLNPEIAQFCADQGKPLLIEKPLTTDFFAARKIVELFDRLALPLTVAQTLRYNSVILALRDNFPAMGRLFSLCATHRLEPSTLSWLEQPELAGGGVIFHTAVHLFDALRFITGEEVVKIRAVARTIYNSRLEDLIIAEAIMSNGALAIIDAGKVSPSRACRYEFVCEKGQLHGDQVHGILQKIEGMKISSLPVKPPGPALLPLLGDWPPASTPAFGCKLCRTRANPDPRTSRTSRTSKVMIASPIKANDLPGRHTVDASANRLYAAHANSIYVPTVKCRRAVRCGVDSCDYPSLRPFTVDLGWGSQPDSPSRPDGDLRRSPAGEFPDRAGLGTPWAARHADGHLRQPAPVFITADSPLRRPDRDTLPYLRVAGLCGGLPRLAHSATGDPNRCDRPPSAWAVVAGVGIRHRYRVVLAMARARGLGGFRRRFPAAVDPPEACARWGTSPAIQPNSRAPSVRPKRASGGSGPALTKQRSAWHKPRSRVPSKK